jgi:hypothetical protein
MGSAGRGVFVGNGVAVDSITGDGAAVQALSRMKAATMIFFIEGNYMSSRRNVIARKTGG